MGGMFKPDNTAEKDAEREAAIAKQTEIQRQSVLQQERIAAIRRSTQSGGGLIPGSPVNAPGGVISSSAIGTNRTLG